MNTVTRPRVLGLRPGAKPQIDPTRAEVDGSPLALLVREEDRRLMATDPAQELRRRASPSCE